MPYFFLRRTEAIGFRRKEGIVYETQLHQGGRRYPFGTGG